MDDKTGFPQAATPQPNPPPVQHSADLRPSGTSPAKSGRWFAYIVGLFIFLGVSIIAIFGIVIFFMVEELNRGKPIRGIEVSVIAPHAPDRAETEANAAKFVNRKLRQSGYSDYDRFTWQIEVILQKIDEEQYQIGHDIIVVDHIRTRVIISDDQGRNVYVFDVPAEPPDTTEIDARGNAETAMKQKMYSLAIMNLVNAEFPAPDELHKMR